MRAQKDWFRRGRVDMGNGDGAEEAGLGENKKDKEKRKGGPMCCLELKGGEGIIPCKSKVICKSILC